MPLDYFNYASTALYRFCFYARLYSIWDWYISKVYSFPYL